MATAHARLSDFLPSVRDALLLCAARAAACLAAWSIGFRALSDDDYARITIAQRFAADPRLDPSGTSWLPLPFWTYGAAFRALGTDLVVAQSVAIALGLAATLLVYGAARVLGASERGAVMGALVSSLAVPYSLLLGLAAVPELPCAALLLLAVATLARNEPGFRLLGALSLSAACLMRYEAWPVALLFSLLSAWDALSRRKGGYALAGGLSLVGAGLWLSLGRLNHGDALFFVARVSAYRRALGGNDVPLWERLLGYPMALVTFAPLLAALLAGLGLLAWFERGALPPRGRVFARSAVAMGALLAFLIVGSVQDGVPTHHAARVLLPLWLFGSVIAGRELDRLARSRSAAASAAIVATACASALLVSCESARHYGFAERELELEAGRAARQAKSGALVIDTRDFGYFAVQAGFGRPSDSSVLDEHDPRRPRARPVAATDFDAALRSRQTQFAVLELDQAALLAPRCARRWNNARFALLECANSDAPLH